MKRGEHFKSKHYFMFLAVMFLSLGFVSAFSFGEFFEDFLGGGSVTGKAIYVDSNECGEFSFEYPVGAEANSEFSAMYPAKNAIDGDSATNWFGEHTGYPKYITLDLGEAKCVSAMKVRLYDSDVPIRAYVEVLSDENTTDAYGSSYGDEWVRVVAGRGWNIDKAGEYNEISFDTVKARYVRLYQVSGKRDYGNANSIEISMASFGENKTKINESVSCFASDGGINYYEKGYVEGNIGSAYPDGSTRYEDYCMDNNTLIERYCGDDYTKFTKEYNCPNGCVDGACIEAPGVCTLQNVTNRVCSYEGIEYNVTHLEGCGPNPAIFRIGYNETEEIINLSHGQKPSSLKGIEGVGLVNLGTPCSVQQSRIRFISTGSFEEEDVSECSTFMDSLHNRSEFLGYELESSFVYMDGRADYSYRGGDSGFYISFYDSENSEIISEVKKLPYEVEEITVGGKDNQYYTIYFIEGIFYAIWHEGNKLIILIYVPDMSAFDRHSFGELLDADEFAEALQDNQFRPLTAVEGAEGYGEFRRILGNVMGLGCSSDVEDFCKPEWEVRMDPVECPSHGVQELIIRDSNRCVSETITETQRCNPGRCDGCLIPRGFSPWEMRNMENVCLPYGHRFGNDEVVDTILLHENEDLSQDYDLNIMSNVRAELTVYVRSSGDGWGAIGAKSYLLYEGAVERLPDSLGGMRFRVEEINMAQGTVRLSLIDSVNSYCDVDGQIKRQRTVDPIRGDWAQCQNNYECESNFCSSGECIEITRMMENAGTFRSLGSRVLCTFANMFDESGYEQCLVDLLGGSSSGSPSGGGS